MSTSRKSHRKTRTGCANCKKRRIKCDELKPSCSNCIKHSIACDFALEASALAPRRSTPCTGSPATSNDNAVPSPGVGPNIGSAISLPETYMVDLKLLHHFTTSTYATLSHKGDIKTLWRVTVPELAFSNGYLMHALLALSALHLSHLEAERHDYYFSYATAHYEVALRDSSSTILIVQSENCHTIYALSALIFAFQMGLSHDADGLLITLDNEIAPWFVLLRGVHSIISSSWSWLQDGVLGPMFRMPTCDNSVEELDECLREFQVHLYANETNKSNLETYITTIDELRKWWNVEPEKSFTWVVKVGEDYLSLLSNRHPEALIIFAHFCVLLKQAESIYWFKNWPRKLISAIYHSLDEAYRLWIRWPLEQIGYYP